jgi:SAM-dependent methyltransferase
VDDLLLAGYLDLSVLDISCAAIETTKLRLGGSASRVGWHVGDISCYDFGVKQYDLWHDRAVFHFLTQATTRAAYADTIRRSVKPGGHVLMATFGPDGPLQCSGLNVVRYDEEQLQKALGVGFNLLGSDLCDHSTPMGTSQQFLYCWFQVGH